MTVNEACAELMFTIPLQIAILRARCVTHKAPARAFLILRAAGINAHDAGLFIVNTLRTERARGKQ